MKYLSRLTALLLALMLLLPAAAGADTQTLNFTSTHYNRALLESILALETAQERSDTMLKLPRGRIQALMVLYYREYQASYPDALCSCYEQNSGAGLKPYGTDHRKDCAWYHNPKLVTGSAATLQLNIPEGAFPADVKVSNEVVINEEMLAKIRSAAVIALMNGTDASVPALTILDTFDISFSNGIGKLQPAEGYPVEMTFTVPTDHVGNAERLVVFHVYQNGSGYAAEVVDSADIAEGAEEQTITVQGTEFSIYLVGAVGDTTGTEVNSTVTLSKGQTVILYSTDVSNNAYSYRWNITDNNNEFTISYNQNNPRYVTITATISNATAYLQFQYKERWNSSWKDLGDRITLKSDNRIAVTFLPGDAGTGSNYTIYSPDGTTFTFPTPEEAGISGPEGSIFVGWSTSKNGQGNNYIANIQGKVSDGTTYYAIWCYPNSEGSPVDGVQFYIRTDGEIKPEPGSYDADDYTSVVYGSLYDQKAINNNLEAVQANIKTPPSDDDIIRVLDAKGIVYNPATHMIVWYVIKHQSDGWHVDGVVRARAEFEVIYQANGGVVTNVPGSLSHVTGSTVPIKYSPFPTRQGYTFLGWDENQNATYPTYVYGSSTSPQSFTMPSNTVYLYAIWMPNDATRYTVEHYLCDVNGVAPATPAKSEPHFGVTDSTAQAAYLTTFVGYAPYPDHASTVDSGTIKPDGSLVLKLYYKPAYTSLTIEKTGMTSGESAIFTVDVKQNNTTVNTFTVVVPGNSGSATIVDLPIGATATITETAAWSWAYTPDQNTKAHTLVADKAANRVTFRNTSENPSALHDETTRFNTRNSNSGITQSGENTLD